MYRLPCQLPEDCSAPGEIRGRLKPQRLSGAILNLGLDRSCLGDILVEESAVHLFCPQPHVFLYLRQLSRVCGIPLSMPAPWKRGSSIMSLNTKRLRGLWRPCAWTVFFRWLSGASRSSLTGLIEGGKVFVNGKLITSNGYQPREGDLVSVRGMGRFRYQGGGGQSKKGREYVTLWRYI